MGQLYNVFAFVLTSQILFALNHQHLYHITCNFMASLLHEHVVCVLCYGCLLVVYLLGHYLHSNGTFLQQLECGYEFPALIHFWIACKLLVNHSNTTAEAIQA